LEFDADNLIVKRAYGNIKQNGEEETFCMYGDNVPNARNEQINEFIRKNLNFKNGDAVLLIGPYSRENCLSMIKEYKGDVGKIVKRFS